MRAFAFAALLLPLPAAAFTAQNGMTAARISQTEIAVPYDAGRADTDYWCAAGDLAQRGLQLPGDTRLWRATPKPRGGGDGIVFTLDPAKKAVDAGLSHFGSGPRDGSITIGTAVGSHCRVIWPLWDY